MENIKTIKGRIQNKHGTEADWYAAGMAETPFCPLEGELIVYDPDAIYEHPRTKYGAKDSEGNLIPVHLLPWASGCDETVGLEFELSQDESYFICSGIGSFRGGELIIPKGHCGLPVKEIGYYAFSDFGFDEDAELQLSEITKVIIPHGIEIIGEWAFYLGFYFVNGGITIPNSVHTLKEGAFWAAECDYIYIPKSVITNVSGLFGDGFGIELKKVYCEYFENELPNTWYPTWNMENVPVIWGATRDVLQLNERIGDTTALETESKEIVGAINELNAKLQEDVIGTWVFKDEIDCPPIPDDAGGKIEYPLVFTVKDSDGNIKTYDTFMVYKESDDHFEIMYINFEMDEYDTAYLHDAWYKDKFRTVSILEEPTEEAFIAWVRENAKKQIPEYQEKTDETLKTTDKTVVGAINELNGKTIDKIANISIGHGEIEADPDYGIYVWGSEEYWDNEENVIYTADRSDIIPIVAGDNVTFEVNEDNTVVKINAAGSTPQISITYNELVNLRDNSELIPGMFYRITDYQCTTTQENTRAMNNQFDIIVQALDVNKLSENASAIQHEGDEYFTDVNLAAWELKYSLDNNANRFWWADEEKGKGIIYYMKDENNNECPYDFKNIQFKRYKVVGCEEVPNYVGQYIATQDGYDLDIDAPDEIEWDADDFIWCYTFTIVLEGVITDYSMFKEWLLVENNNVKAYSWHDRQMLNNNVFISPRGFEAEDNSHFFGNNIIDGVYNTISVDYYIRTNSIIGICNTFSSYGVEEAHIEGSDNLFGGDVYRVILPNCGLNIFSGFAQELSFGPGCTYNYFGNIAESSLGCGCTNIRFCYPDYTPQYYLRRLVVGNGCSRVKLINNEKGSWSNCVQDITISSGIQEKELQVSRNAAPVVFEAANTTHIILD